MGLSTDMDVKDPINCTNKPLVALDSPKIQNRDDGEDSESNSLLPPRRGGMSRRQDKVRRKVQWNDRNGNKLVEVLEFQPSDVSDTDDEESDSCICTLM